MPQHGPVPGDPQKTTSLVEQGSVDRQRATRLNIDVPGVLDKVAEQEPIDLNRMCRLVDQGSIHYATHGDEDRSLVLHRRHGVEAAADLNQAFVDEVVVSETSRRDIEIAGLSYSQLAGGQIQESVGIGKNVGSQRCLVFNPPVDQHHAGIADQRFVEKRRAGPDGKKGTGLVVDSRLRSADGRRRQGDGLRIRRRDRVVQKELRVVFAAEKSVVVERAPHRYVGITDPVEEIVDRGSGGAEQPSQRRNGQNRGPVGRREGHGVAAGKQLSRIEKPAGSGQAQGIGFDQPDTLVGGYPAAQVKPPELAAETGTQLALIENIAGQRYGAANAAKRRIQFARRGDGEWARGRQGIDLAGRHLIVGIDLHRLCPHGRDRHDGGNSQTHKQTACAASVIFHGASFLEWRILRWPKQRSGSVCLNRNPRKISTSLAG